jgi:integrase
MAMSRRIKGTGYLFRRGETWYIRHVINGEPKETSLRVRNKREAETKAKDYYPVVQASTMQEIGLHVAKARKLIRGKISFREAWEMFVVHPRRPRKGGEHTWRDYEIIWNRFRTWAEGAGCKCLENVTEIDAGKFYDSLADLSGNRANKILALCRTVYRVLDVDPDPFTGIDRRPQPAENHRALTPEELVTVLNAANEDLRLLMMLAAFASMRLADAVLLDWESVNLTMPNPTLTFIPRKTRTKKPKSIHFPMHPDIQEALMQTPPEDRKGYVLPKMEAMYSRDRGSVSSMVSRHFKKCGISTTKKRTDGKKAVSVASFHCLRTTFVSICAQNGVPLGSIQELCGHESPAVQAYYLRTGDEAARTAVNALPRLKVDSVEVLSRAKLVALAQSIPVASIPAAMEALEKFSDDGDDKTSESNSTDPPILP